MKKYVETHQSENEHEERDRDHGKFNGGGAVVAPQKAAGIAVFYVAPLVIGRLRLSWTHDWNLDCRI